MGKINFPKISQKNFKKPIDKLILLCYNIDTIKEEIKPLKERN